MLLKICENIVCWLKKTIYLSVHGTTCKVKKDCKDLAHSRCKDKVCICKRGYKYIKDREACAKSTDSSDEPTTVAPNSNTEIPGNIIVLS